jgi:hypothetical protein
MPPRRRSYLLRLVYRFEALDDPDARERVAGVVEQAFRGVGVRDARVEVQLRALREREPPRAVALPA